jgi:hypothetical protein
MCCATSADKSTLPLADTRRLHITSRRTTIPEMCAVRISGAVSRHEYEKTSDEKTRYEIEKTSDVKHANERINEIGTGMRQTAVLLTLTVIADTNAPALTCAESPVEVARRTGARRCRRRRRRRRDPRLGSLALIAGWFNRQIILYNLCWLCATESLFAACVGRAARR